MIKQFGSSPIQITIPETDTTKPYAPQDFIQVEDTSYDTGIAIHDKDENQYVWVEVPMTTEVYKTAGLGITNFTDDNYTKIENDLHSYTNIYRNGTTFSDTCYSTEQTGLTSEQYNTKKKEMLKSVYQNGGFWIGKYETGDKTSTINNTVRNNDSGISDVAVIKNDLHPYDFITCSQAETIAERLNPDSSKYNTDLLFGVQWDLTLKYLETKGTSQDDLIKDSTSWGNCKSSNFDITKGQYNVVNQTNWTLTTWNPVNTKYTKANDTDILLTTGATDRNSKQGIYDLAGNAWEWTLEYTSDPTNPCAFRGGDCCDGGSNFTAAGRVKNSTNYTDDNFDFRVCMYKK